MAVGGGLLLYGCALPLKYLGDVISLYGWPLIIFLGIIPVIESGVTEAVVVLVQHW